MILKRAPYGLAALVLLSACGKPAGVTPAPANGSEASTETPAPAPVSAEAETEAGTNAGPVNAFAFEETGTQMRGPVPAAGDVSLAGGCNGKTPISLTMYSGTPNNETWFNVAFDTEGVVGPGETGTFPLASLEWDNGVMRPETLPEDSPFRVPVRLEGTGTLTLDAHQASTDVRRMVGTLKGHVAQQDGNETADLTVRFDINLSCGVNF
ncbi:hypothetical protein [Hyphomonas johnsonii]|uniref:Lipoprotein n=1 Tax=Hyphomonas johnsonii MHS-2 TaxID=1280950 RepID=A0A059FAH1_9PROT|nr:hypothetical protein [Hyphomonas johnsonii]KCZ87619.1 hypothetical protein HJO_16640 [Hyphomonas johnsonii MHS-2]